MLWSSAQRDKNTLGGGGGDGEMRTDERASVGEGELCGDSLMNLFKGGGGGDEIWGSLRGQKGGTREREQML